MKKKVAPWLTALSAAPADDLLANRVSDGQPFAGCPDHRESRGVGQEHEEYVGGLLEKEAVVQFAAHRSRPQSGVTPRS